MEATGYESAFVTTGDPQPRQRPTQSPQIDKKTPKPAVKETKGQQATQNAVNIVDQTGEKNVLFGYRSITYNWTLAGLDKEYLKKPEKLRQSTLDFVIAKSGGKGYQGFLLPGEPTDDEKRRANVEVLDARDARFKAAQQSINNKKIENVALVRDFNKNSPGRFDLFIDSIEIDTTMAFTRESNVTLPTKFNFEIIEPYSINGFIEALHVAAVAAGFPSYVGAPFVFKLEFWGIPDSDTFSFKDPVKIPDSERYFPFGLAGVDVEVTDRGTRYKCTAVPFEQRYMGQPNKLKKPIKMEGVSVASILKNFMEGLNKQNVEMYLASHSGGKANEVDEYKVKFVDWSETEGWIENDNGVLPGKKLVELHKDNALYGMIDPAASGIRSAYKEQGKKQPTPEEKEKAPASIKYVPGQTVVHFQEGMNVHDVLTAVVRDSEYIRDILKDVKKHTDIYGMVDYFQVRMEVVPTDIDNPHLKRPAQVFTFVVSPYKIHYTKIPNLADNIINEKELRKLSRREYNYLYTGLNVDVINFKLNFNTLYFEAIPAALGQKDQSDGKSAAGNQNTPAAQQKSTDNQTASQLQVPLNPKQVVETQIQAYSGTGSQPLSDPYSELARNLHNAVVNSKSNMLTGEIEIAGDPFYLVTGGMGNYNPKPAGPGKVAGGEAAFAQQALMITINFRNPIDILPLENGGTMYFDPNRIPFSGVYMVTQCTSTFKDGRFVQRLQVVRVPGQVLDYNVKATDLTTYVTTKADPKNQIVSDANIAQAPAVRADSDSVTVQLERSIPNPGLPNQPSNFVNNPGSLGGNINSLLPRTAGLVGRNGELFAASSVIGQTLPSDPLTNIRLNNSGLSALNQTNLGTAALIAAAANVITGNVPAKRAVGVIAGGVLGSVINSALTKSNQGSGIGEGATLKISAGENISLPIESLSNVDSIKDLGTKAVDTVMGIGTRAQNFVSGIGDKVKSMVASAADPQAIAAQVGLDASKMSGLAANLQSKLPTQISNYVKNVPIDTDLVNAFNSGLVLDYIPSSKVKNIPATIPYTTAPEPLPDPAATVQAAAATVKAAITSQLSNNNLPNFRQLNMVDKTVITDKIATAQTQLSKLTGDTVQKGLDHAKSVATNLGSNFKSSPLARLVDSVKNNDSGITDV